MYLSAREGPGVVVIAETVVNRARTTRFRQPFGVVSNQAS